MIKKIFLIVFSAQLFLFAGDSGNENICTDRYFNLSITASNQITILDLVDNLANECQLSVIFEDGGLTQHLQKKIGYINARNYSLTELFDLIFSENNIYYEYESKRQILRLAYRKTQTFNVDYVNFSDKKTTSKKSVQLGVKSEEGSNTNDFTTSMTNSFDFWDKIEEEVKNIVELDSFEASINAKTMLNKDAGTLTVTATKKQLARVEKYLDKIMNRLHQQVMIEAKMIEVTTSDSDSKGIDWSQLYNLQNITGGTAFMRTKNVDTYEFDPQEGGMNINQITENGFYNAGALGLQSTIQLDQILKFLNSHGEVEVVSNPKIVTLNNQPAVMNVGQQMHYKSSSSSYEASGDGATSLSSTTVDSMFVGTSLNITPQITEDGYIMLTIQPVISSLVSSNAVDDPELPPDTKIKEMSSIVKVKEGNKVIIGGLIEDSIDDSSRKVPLLGDIPILGYAFKHEKKVKKKTELVIILTPHFVDGSTTPSLEEFEQGYKKVKDQ